MYLDFYKIYILKEGTIMNEKITIFNFDNIYKKQDFYKKENYKWIDFSDLSGVTRYCDSNALKIIRKRINNKEPTKINFIDSGNYHYISELWLKKIQDDFMLVRKASRLSTRLSPKSRLSWQVRKRT
jgi:hypothetical protein